MLLWLLFAVENYKDPPCVDGQPLAARRNPQAGIATLSRGIRSLDHKHVFRAEQPYNVIRSFSTPDPPAHQRIDKRRVDTTPTPMSDARQQSAMFFYCCQSY